MKRFRCENSVYKLNFKNQTLRGPKFSMCESPKLGL